MGAEIGGPPGIGISETQAVTEPRRVAVLEFGCHLGKRIGRSKPDPVKPGGESDLPMRSACHRSSPGSTTRRNRTSPSSASRSSASISSCSRSSDDPEWRMNVTTQSLQRSVSRPRQVSQSMCIPRRYALSGIEKTSDSASDGFREIGVNDLGRGRSSDVYGR